MKNFRQYTQTKMRYIKKFESKSDSYISELIDIIMSDHKIMFENIFDLFQDYSDEGFILRIKVYFQVFGSSEYHSPIFILYNDQEKLKISSRIDQNYEDNIFDIQNLIENFKNVSENLSLAIEVMDSPSFTVGDFYILNNITDKFIKKIRGMYDLRILAIDGYSEFIEDDPEDDTAADDHEYMIKSLLCVIN